MVHIVDEGSYFEVSIDKVWKLNELHGTEGGKIHPGMKNQRFEEVDESTTFFSWDAVEEGTIIHNKAKVRSYPPLGSVFEFVEGPMAGSICFNFYTPKGNRTAVTTVGEFRSATMRDAELERAARRFLDIGYNEDKAYLQIAKL